MDDRERYGMDMDDVELSDSFEDWFMRTMDRESIEEMRSCGAWIVGGGLNDPYIKWALFDRFGSTISDLAMARLGVELWEVARDEKIQGLGDLMTILIHAAAESLAHSLAHRFEESIDASVDRHYS